MKTLGVKNADMNVVLIFIAGIWWLVHGLWMHRPGSHWVGTSIGQQ